MVEREETRDRVVGVRYRVSIFYANSTRVINKMEMLRGIACTEELDIIGITETWLDSRQAFPTRSRNRWVHSLSQR